MVLRRTSTFGFSSIAVAWLFVGCGASGASDEAEAGASDVLDQTATRTPQLPTPTIACPTLVDGMVSLGSSQVRIWRGPDGKKGPLLLYWHATGTDYNEVQLGFSAAISEVQQSGGVVASFVSTTFSGYNTGDFVWFTGDFNVADNVVACANQQGLIDPTRIYTSGYSAGGLQCGSMVYLRSHYLAGALCMSGGLSKLLALTAPLYRMQSSTDYVAPVIAAHGAPLLDFFVVDFATCSNDLCTDRSKKGGFAVNCNDGGDHIIGTITRTSTMGPIGWKWFKEIPFGTSPSKTSRLPSYFPSYCTITK